MNSMIVCEDTVEQNQFIFLNYLIILGTIIVHVVGKIYLNFVNIKKACMLCFRHVRCN